MKMDQPLLSFRHLDLGYGTKRVLQDVHFEVHEGELWFFVGPNAEGKTTLLRAVLGEISPLRGEVVFGSGNEIQEHIGFVPQRCNLNPTLPTTVREFVSLGFAGVRLGNREKAERLSSALERVGLAGLLKEDYWALSGGQRQRALVARALVRKPRLLVLDEPTKGIDISAETRFLRFLLDLNDRDRLTVIFVAHNLNIAARYGTHVALFGAGKVLAGENHRVLTSENLERTYGVPMTAQNGSDGFAIIDVRGEGVP
jgi:zinc transport system ATP-binding protein